MADKVKVKINSKGARALLNSEAIQADLLRRAEAILPAEPAGGFAADVRAGKNRGRAMVKTVSVHGARHNAKHQTILKNLDKGR